MLSDYAHERWAASRYVTPELWRPVGKFLNEEFLNDIKRLFEKGSDLDKQAAALALNDSDFAPAKKFLDDHRHLHSQIKSGELNWDLISEKWHANKN